MSRRQSIVSRAALVAALCVAPTTTAFAQEAGATASGLDAATQLDEIMVTAQKRGENVQNVPIAITALSGEVMAERGVRNALDLTQFVPGLQINNLFQSSNPTIFLRGVGVNDYNAASSGAVGVTVDDVFLNSSVGQLFAVFDVDRVEVLKGPQGTLYGRNTTGGVINYVTRRPTFSPEFTASVGAGRFNQVFFDAAGGGPLIDDRLAARASVVVKRRDGWGVNLQDGRDINGIETYAGRLQFLFTPTPDIEIQNKIEGGFSKSSALGHQSLGTFHLTANRACTGEEVLARTICVNPISGYKANANIDEFNTNVRDNYENLTNFADRLSVVWNGDNLSLTSITGYVYNKRDLNQDIEYSPFAIAELPVWVEKSEQVSNELRLASNGDGPLKWVAGLYYLQEKLSSVTNLSVLREFNPDPTQPHFDPANSVLTVERVFTQRTASKAVFAQVDYEVTDQLTVTAGLRYTDDKKTLSFITYGGPVNPDSDPRARLQDRLVGFVDADPTNFAIDLPSRTVTTLKKPTWRLALAYKASPTVNAYASYSRGLRAGGYNTAALFNGIEFNAVDPESIDAFEAGVKTDLFDRTWRVNASAFYYDYRNLQVFSLEPNPAGGVPLQRLQNADAEVYGAEVEIQARPMRGLDLNLGAAYVHATYADFIDPIRGDFNGNRLDKTPRLQATGSATYRFDLSDGWTARVGGDFSYQSKVYFSALNDAPMVSARHGEVNLNAGVSHSSGVDLSVFVRNVGDNRYLTDMNDLSSLGFFFPVFNEPRTYGLTLRYTM
ncbi:MAG: TonB-dependent receptor [Phenylobacterium sp.]|uniref:TonB-dependent receptor n=1 Tax=Phenylobacterium sp. TaxID=1871053 RepID=UPI0027375412|nr:TonB-dependent receptor [Phenylobacterium sp.]MDP3747397.1 TonB-dependent receptor [Phenylobacterium sp.]